MRPRRRDNFAEEKALTGRTESIARGELPHAGEQLCEASDAESHGHNNVGGRDAPRTGVVEGQDKGGRREGEQTTAKRVSPSQVVAGK